MGLNLKTLMVPLKREIKEYFNGIVVVTATMIFG